VASLDCGVSATGDGGQSGPKDSGAFSHHCARFAPASGTMTRAKLAWSGLDLRGEHYRMKALVVLFASLLLAGCFGGGGLDSRHAHSAH
jgi:hypothetical protein